MEDPTAPAPPGTYIHFERQDPTELIKHTNCISEEKLRIVSKGGRVIPVYSSILHVASPLVRAVASSSCSCVTPAISVPVATTRRTVQLLVSLLHHGQATITRDERTNLGAVLESIEDLGNCLQIEVGEGGYDVDEIASSSTTRNNNGKTEYERSKYLADLDFDKLMAEVDATLSEMGIPVHPNPSNINVDDVDRDLRDNNSNSVAARDLANVDHDADKNAFNEEEDEDRNNNLTDHDDDEELEKVHQNNDDPYEDSCVSKRLRKRRSRMTYPSGEEEPGHVGKLPQDVGSTRLVTSSTARKKKNSDQVLDKAEEMRKKRKNGKKGKKMTYYERNKQKYKEYYERNKEEKKEYQRNYKLRMKEKEKKKKHQRMEEEEAALSCVAEFADVDKSRNEEIDTVENLTENSAHIGDDCEEKVVKSTQDDVNEEAGAGHESLDDDDYDDLLLNMSP